MTRLEIKVIPNAKKNCVDGWEGNRLKLRIAAQPEKGKANQALVQFLSKLFGIPKSSISILTGESSGLKTILIDCVTKEYLDSVLKTIAD